MGTLNKQIETMTMIMNMAKRYRLYLLGLAYIPYQDLPRYERAYKEWYS